MQTTVLAIIFFFIAMEVVGARSGLKRYTPDWPSLDTRPLPQWYDDAKIGKNLFYSYYWFFFLKKFMNFFLNIHEFSIK